MEAVLALVGAVVVPPSLIPATKVADVVVRACFLPCEDEWPACSLVDAIQVATLDAILVAVAIAPNCWIAFVRWFQLAVAVAKTNAKTAAVHDCWTEYVV